MVSKFSLAAPSVRSDEFFLPPYIPGNLCSCCRFSDIHLIIYWRYLWDIACPKKVFIFRMCIWTPCMFNFDVFSAVSNMDIHLRAPIRSWGSSKLSGKVVRDYLAYFLPLEISAQATDILLPPNLLCGIHYCLRVSLLLLSRLVGLFGILLVPKRFPGFLGLQNSRRDFSAPASDVLVIEGNA